jgi:hypothetical protein
MKLPVSKTTWNIGISIVANLAPLLAGLVFATHNSNPVVFIELGLLVISVVYFAQKKDMAGFFVTAGHMLAVALLKFGITPKGPDILTMGAHFLAVFLSILSLFDVEFIKGSRIFLILPLFGIIALRVLTR